MTVTYEMEYNSEIQCPFTWLPVFLLIFCSLSLLLICVCPNQVTNYPRVLSYLPSSPAELTKIRQPPEKNGY